MKINWTPHNVYQYQNKPLVASGSGQKYKWYTNGDGRMVLRLDGLFGLVIIETYDVTELLYYLNLMSMYPSIH